MAVCVVGSFVQDLSFKTEHFPAPGETRIGRFKTGPGGKGFNQAVACARQNVETYFIGAVGDDVFGAGARAFAEQEKIDARFEVVSGAASGAASIVVGPSAQNMIVVALGANDCLSPDFVSRNADCIAKASILVCQLECALDSIKNAFAIARENSTISILNPAPINDGVDAELLALADILIPNESELSFLSTKLLGRSVIDFNNDQALTDVCSELGLTCAVVTLGEAGCFVFDARGRNVETFRIGAVAVDAADTTGAGDAFCGGFAAALSRDSADLRRAALEGTVVAGLSVTREGTAPAMPKRDEVERLGAEHGLL